MYSLINYILKFVFPEKCIICRNVLPLSFEDNILCKYCENNTPFLKENLCTKCGKPISEGYHLCSLCETRSQIFDIGFSAFEYSILKSSIAHFKYQKYQNDGEKFSKLMIDYAKLYHKDIIEKTDIILPVPLSNKKLKDRGFNQADLLGKYLATGFNKQYYTDILVRAINTLPQNSLNPQQRAKNIKDAFKIIDSTKIDNKNILLIDDIFTTGSTINECARILKMNGANEVYFYTLSTTK